MKQRGYRGGSLPDPMPNPPIPAHLGGFGIGEHGDEATYFPDLWRWLVNVRGINTVLDVGCGQGHSTNYFADLGAYAHGIDGVPVPRRADGTGGSFEVFDFAEARYETIVPYDMVWAVEFVEHVEEQYRENFAPAFQAGNLVLMTHAFPGQAGHHHVNCRDSSYWANWMGLLGFELDETLTQGTRALAALNPSPWNHFVRSGMAFVKVR